MSKDSESRFTITFGHSGRVVKKSGRGTNDGISGSSSANGSKRSVKDRLGTIVENSLEDESHHWFKRQRVEQSHDFGRSNGSNDTSFGNGDLRLKLMQKNVSRQFQNSDPPADVDLRVKLSQKANLPSADGSCSPKAVLGKRKNTLGTRDIDNGRLHDMVVERGTYDSEKQNTRELRGKYSVERRSILELRGTYNGERQSLRELRGTYSFERQSMGVHRDNYRTERRSVGVPRDNYSVERRSMREPRDSYNAERRSMGVPRGSHNVERRSMREPRDSHIVERRSMQEPRDGYNYESKSMQAPRDIRNAARRSMREPRDSSNVESRSMQGLRDSYNVARRTMQEPRDIYNIERRNIREPGNTYNFERQSMPDPRDSYNGGRRSMPDPRDNYNVGRRSMQEPRDTYSSGRRSMREPRGSYGFEEPRMPELRDNYSIGRRSIQVSRETYVERHSVREPRDGFSGRDEYYNRRMSNVRPRSKMESNVPAVGPARTPYASDNLRRRSPDTEYGSSMSPKSSEEPQRKPPTRTYDTLRRRSPDMLSGSSLSPERSEEPQRKPLIRTYDNLRRRSPDSVSGSSLSPERSEEPQRKPLSRTYDDDDVDVDDDDDDDDDDGTSNLYRGNEVASPPQREARSASLTKPPRSNAASHQPDIAALVTAQYPQSSGVVRIIPNHGAQPTIDSFLESLDLEEYSIRFKEEEVDFSALTEMSETELHELGIPMGPRKRILHALLTQTRR